MIINTTFKEQSWILEQSFTFKIFYWIVIIGRFTNETTGTFGSVEPNYKMLLKKFFARTLVGIAHTHPPHSHNDLSLQDRKALSGWSKGFGIDYWFPIYSEGLGWQYHYLGEEIHLITKKKKLIPLIMWKGKGFIWLIIQ